VSRKSGIPKRKRTRDEAYQDLRRQVHFIRKSCADFDRGDVDEATRLATPIVNIVFDKGTHTSLLTQLNQKEIEFVDTATPDQPGNLIAYSGLYATFMGVGVIDLKPHLDDGLVPPRLVDFDHWWNTPVFNDRKETVFSRGDLLRFVRDTDGGAHIDPDLHEGYARLAKEKSDGWTMTVNGVEVKPKTGPDQASLRQIAHEVMLTLKRAFPTL
jgi:hypothetical protein